MKKLLLLFMALLCLGGSEAWADETYTIIDNAAGGVWPNGSYSTTNPNTSSNWQVGWTSTSINPQFSVSTTNYLVNNSTGNIASGGTSAVYTISKMGAYRITGYDITFQNVNTNGSNDQTITPSAGGSAATAVGTGEATVNVTGLHAESTTFTLSGNNTYAKVTSFKVYYETVTSGTWASGVSDDVIDAHYSTVWYVQLTSPNYWDVFFDSFEITHRSDGSSDYEGNTYLAFTYNVFADQENHKANEFIAISSNYSTRAAASTKNKVIYNFPEKVRLNGSEIVYACFVSDNGDGTYNLQKRGLGVCKTSSNGSLYIGNKNTYVNTIGEAAGYQCHYTCDYTVAYDFPSTRLSSGINNKDKTNGGWIEVAYMKYNVPGSAGDYIHFDQFSMSMRDDKVVASTYLLFSTECLTGTGVTSSTEFAPSHFTAISTNCIPSENYGKVFTFTFDSDAYLAAGQTYYIYMGTKSGSNYCLQKYGLFISHDVLSGTGFQYSTALETAAPSTQNTWQAIYYSNTYTSGALNDLISSAYAPVNALKDKLGTGLGQYSHSSYSTAEINTALSAAETAYAGSDAIVKVSSIQTLRDINNGSFTLNLPTSGMFLRIKSKQHSTYLNGVASTTPSVGYLTCVETPNNSSIFYYDSNKKLIDYGQGYEANGEDAGTVGGSGTAYTFVASTMGVAGTYAITYGSTSYLTAWGTGYNLTTKEDSENVNGVFTIEEVTSLPVTFYGQYASFCSPVDLEIPSGVKAYTGTMNDAKTVLTLNEIEGTTLPHNTGVILKLEDSFTEETTKNFTILSTTTDGMSDLLGTTAAESVTADTKLVLGKSGDEWGIYSYGGTELGGFKAYMNKPVNGVKGFTFNFSDADVIRAIENGQKTVENVIYDMSGRRVSQPSRGLYIVDGKKVAVK